MESGSIIWFLECNIFFKIPIVLHNVMILFLNVIYRNSGSYKSLFTGIVLNGAIFNTGNYCMVPYESGGWWYPTCGGERVSGSD
jgi:hypothetical protein